MSTTKENVEYLLNAVNHMSKDQQKLLETIKASNKIMEDTKEASNANLTAVVAKEIIDKSKAVATDELADLVAKTAKTRLEKEVGIIPQTLDITVDDKKISQVKGIFHSKFPKLLKIVASKVPLLLVGPAGSGKNVTLEQIAKALKLDFYFTNAVSEEYKLTGFIDANGKYHETQFYKAFKNGGIFFLDEVDASIPDALIILNAAIANGYFDFPIGRVTAHPDFRVVAAANTFGLGSDIQYVGRNQLDAATLDRFVTVYFDYDNKVEKALATDKDLYRFVLASRIVLTEMQLRYIVSMRATINGCKLVNVLSPEEIIKDVIFKGATKDDLNTINSKITEHASHSNLYVKALNNVVHGRTGAKRDTTKDDTPFVDETDDSDSDDTGVDSGWSDDIAW